MYFEVPACLKYWVWLKMSSVFLPCWYLPLQIIFSLLIKWCDDWHVYFGFSFFLSKVMIKYPTWAWSFVVTTEKKKDIKSFPSRNVQVKVIILLRKICGNLLGLWYGGFNMMSYKTETVPSKTSLCGRETLRWWQKHVEA